MANDEKMSIHERDKYLRKTQKRYLKSNRSTKAKLLDEMQEVTELHRKSLTRLMGSTIQRKPRNRQRGSTYGPQVQCALHVISESLDHICAERLQPNLLLVAQRAGQYDESDISQNLLRKLEKFCAPSGG